MNRFKMAVLSVSLCLASCGKPSSSGDTPSRLDPPPAPEVLNLKFLTALADVDLGDTVELDLEASGATGSLQWSAEGSLPLGLELQGNGPRARLHGIVREAKTYTATIRVREARGRSAEVDVTITVRDKPIQWVTTALPSARQGSGQLV